MMKIKKILTIILMLVLVIVLTACSDKSSTDDGTGDNGAGGTQVAQLIIDNRQNPIPVSIYSSWDRIAENRLINQLEGGRQSATISFGAFPQGFVFYPTYFVRIDGHTFVISPQHGNVDLPVPANTITTVTVRPLSSLFTRNQSLTNNSYLRIVNEGFTTIRLVSGSVIISELAPSESAVINVHTGPAANYHLLVTEGGEQIFNLPALTFTAGQFTIMEFNGVNINHLRTTAIVLANAEWF
ncbi:MAG: hypothetical protein FWE37_04925 [Spirochaetaceae bacterium]|nr:hypothetical protein [Spirochaetaceae bacterium]